MSCDGLIGHMSAQMSSLFNKAPDVNCHYCQLLTVALCARWYLVIYQEDEPSQIALCCLYDNFISDKEEGSIRGSPCGLCVHSGS